MSNVVSDNPIVVRRERVGLSRAQFARATGCSYRELEKAELGFCQHLPRQVRSALAACGLDAEAVEREYREWRRSLLQPPHIEE